MTCRRYAWTEYWCHAHEIHIAPSRCWSMSMDRRRARWSLPFWLPVTRKAAADSLRIGRSLGRKYQLLICNITEHIDPSC